MTYQGSEEVFAVLAKIGVVQEINIAAGDR